MRLIDYLKVETLHDSSIESIELDGDCLKLGISVFDEKTDVELRAIAYFYTSSIENSDAIIKEAMRKGASIGILSIECVEANGGYQTDIMAENFVYKTKEKNFLKISIFSDAAEILMD